MKRRLLCLILLTFIALAGMQCSAHGENQLRSPEEIERVFASCRERRSGRISFTCSRSLFEEVRAEGFHMLFRLCCQAGMTLPSFRYSTDGRIELEDVTWDPEIHFAEVTFLSDAAAVCQRFLDDGCTYFTLLGPETLITSLFDDGELLPVLNRLGVETCQMQGNAASGCIRVEKIGMFPAWANVENVEDAAEAIRSFREDGVQRFALVFDEAVFSGLSQSDLRRMEFLGGIAGARFGMDLSAGMMTYEQISWSDLPGVFCGSDEDVVQAIQRMGVQGIRDFQLMLSPELYESVTEKSFRHLFELEGQAGMKNARFSSGEDTCLLQFEAAEIVADAVMLTTVPEVRDALIYCSDHGEKECTLFLSGDLYDLLMDNRENAGLQELTTHAGIMNYTVQASRFSGVVTLRDLVFTPGTVILRARAEGAEESLSPGLQETLRRALGIVLFCREDSDLETARALHDWLCRNVTYGVNEDTDEDDSCIGAILNGAANCDGYADAFFLLGRLAGLEVLCQQGTDVRSDEGTSDHMWNWLQLDGTWRLVDVTWDDRGDDREPGYVFFNLGADRAHRSHRWQEGLSPDLLPETDVFQRPTAEFCISDPADLQDAVRDALDAGCTTFDLYATDPDSLSGEAIREALANLLLRSWSSYWLDPPGVLSILLNGS